MWRGGLGYRGDLAGVGIERDREVGHTAGHELVVSSDPFCLFLNRCLHIRSVISSSRLLIGTFTNTVTIHQEFKSPTGPNWLPGLSQ